MCLIRNYPLNMTFKNLSGTQVHSLCKFLKFEAIYDIVLQINTDHERKFWGSYFNGYWLRAAAASPTFTVFFLLRPSLDPNFFWLRVVSRRALYYPKGLIRRHLREAQPNLAEGLTLFCLHGQSPDLGSTAVLVNKT